MEERSNLTAVVFMAGFMYFVFGKINDTKKLVKCCDGLGRQLSCLRPV